MPLPMNGTAGELVPEISQKTAPEKAVDSDSNSQSNVDTTAAATPMLKSTSSTTVSPEDDAGESTTKNQPESSDNVLAMTSAAQKQESPMAKSSDGIASAAPAAKSPPGPKNVPDMGSDERNIEKKNKISPPDSSDVTDVLLTASSTDTEPTTTRTVDISSKLKTEEAPTASTEKLSESPPTISPTKEQESTLPVSEGSDVKMKVSETVKRQGEMGNSCLSTSTAMDTKDNDAKTQTTAEEESPTLEKGHVTMEEAGAAGSIKEDTADETCKNGAIAEKETINDDTTVTKAKDETTTSEKFDTITKQAGSSSPTAVEVLPTVVEKVEKGPQETPAISIEKLEKGQEKVQSVAAPENPPNQQDEQDIEMKDAETVATTTKVESRPLEEEKDESMAEEDDSEEQVEASLSELMEVLAEVDTPGSTCAAGPAPCLPSIPGLSVDGVGDISLPISDAQAKLLASVSEQAPHGKGMETIVDKSVRNTLQVDPSKVTIQNPAWESALKKLVHQASESLGVSPSLVNAELYKLLLYEPGGFFKKHRDTEKAKGMFATLVVQLPSKFTGGSFVVSHGGESETFTLGAGGDAAYGCHFVCHYADCEHEIQKVESGHRLALIYSLCYTGPGKPSANDVGHNDLSRALRNLPSDESMFVIPLDHQYTTASLARLGAGALKGSDRARQGAIEVAGKGSWTTIIAEASRTDSESGGGGGYYGGFEVYDVERGSVHLSDAYYADGGDANDQLKWINRQITFDSVEDGGMVLVSSEELEEDGGVAIWGEGDSGSVEYTGNEGATRETTYSTYIMIAYSEETAFERMCAAEFKSAVSHVIHEESPDLLRRILAYMKNRKPSISNGDSVRLFQALDSIGITDEEALAGFITILSSTGKETPSSQLADALISSLKRFGWEPCMESIKAFATRLGSRKDLNTLDFVQRVDFLLRMQKTSGSGDFDATLDDFIKIFDASTKTSTPSSGYGGYGYGYRHSYNTSTQTDVDALVSLAQRHPSTKTKAVVQACVARMRKQGTTSDKLAKRANVLQRLRTFYDPHDVENWFRDVVEDFISVVASLPPNAPGSSRYGGSSDLLSSSNADDLFRRLLEFGTSNEIKKVESWAVKAQLGQLSKLEQVLGRVSNASLGAPTYRDAAAVNAFIQAVSSRIKILKLSDLHSRHQKLLVATQGGPPVFSWSMPQASTSNPALTAFLGSQRTGPETIVVGGGINNARSLAGTSRHSYSYGRYSSSSNRSFDRLTRGYSATIEVTGAIGQNASVRVTKTRALYDARMKKYREDLSELTKVAEEIRNHGGVVAVPSTGAASSAARPIIAIDGADSQPNPANKRRVKAPIPSDAEIVEID